MKDLISFSTIWVRHNQVSRSIFLNTRTYVLFFSQTKILIKEIYIYLSQLNVYANFNKIICSTDVLHQDSL